MNAATNEAHSAALVSVVIPIRDRSALFSTTIESLRQQTHPFWEAIVVDDGSTAEEFDRIATLVASDSRVRLLRRTRPPAGACACRNAGVAAANGRYILFLDSDDALAPGCLAHRIAVLAVHPEAAFAAFPSWCFHQVPGDSDRRWNPFDRGDAIERFLRGDSPWQTSGVLWRRLALEQVGPWDQRLKSWQDSEFHVRALVSCARHVALDEPDAYWRRPTDAGSLSQSARKPLYVFNRARMLVRLGVWLREHGALTEPRRRALSMKLFEHALRTPLARSRALALWRLGRRSGVVRWHEYGLALFFDSVERVARRFAYFGLRTIYPQFERYPSEVS